MIIYITNDIIPLVGDNMENIIYNDVTYNRLFKNNNMIIKYSSLNIEACKKLMEKNISFINTPIDCSKLSIIEKRLFTNCDSKITLPYLHDYYTLYNYPFIQKCNNLDILLLIKKMLLYLKNMHNNNIYHGDLYSKNIMMNNDLDISFIDLDTAIIDNIVSEENVYCNDELSIQQMINKTASDDKKSLFMLLCYYLVNKNFNADISYRVDIDRLIIPNYLLSEIKTYLEKRNPELNYYYIDIIDELLMYEQKNKINVKKI